MGKSSEGLGRDCEGAKVFTVKSALSVFWTWVGGFLAFGHVSALPVFVNIEIYKTVTRLGKA